MQSFASVITKNVSLEPDFQQQVLVWEHLKGAERGNLKRDLKGKMSRCQGHAVRGGRDSPVLSTQPSL